MFLVAWESPQSKHFGVVILGEGVKEGVEGMFLSVGDVFAFCGVPVGMGLR